MCTTIHNAYIYKKAFYYIYTIFTTTIDTVLVAKYTYNIK